MRAGLALVAALAVLSSGAEARADLPPALPASEPVAAPESESTALPAEEAPADPDPLPASSLAALPDGVLPRPAPPPDTAGDSLIVVTGGLTLVGVGLGSLFGALAISRWGDTKNAAKAGCQVPASYRGCTQEVGDLQVEASSFATVSTFCFIAGTAALGGTILLWSTGRRGEVPLLGRSTTLAPAVGPGIAGGLLTGVF